MSHGHGRTEEPYTPTSGSSQLLPISFLCALEFVRNSAAAAAICRKMLRNLLRSVDDVVEMILVHFWLAILG